MNPVELGIFASRLDAVCDEMGAILRNAAFSPNIRDRLDFSCALFDGRGRLVAQAAHLPVHLGAARASVAAVIETAKAKNGADRRGRPGCRTHPEGVSLTCRSLSRAALSQENAWMPVMARPRISAWMSCVPS